MNRTTSTDYSKWKRWTQEGPFFPKPKYGFTKHLRKVGDYIVSYPMSKLDCMRMQHAAKAWAYHHKKRISTELLYHNATEYQMKVMLTSQHRHRQYDL